MRWKIETFSRDLTCTIGLSSFHSKKVEFIKQEIFAKLILYNFFAIIAAHIVIQKNSCKHMYRLNFFSAAHSGRQFLLDRSALSPPDVEALLLKYFEPVEMDDAPLEKTNSSASHTERFTRLS